MGLDSASKSFQNAVQNPLKKKLKPSVRGQDFPEGFRFEEVTGPMEEVTLAGSWMPKVPFTFGGEQKVIKQFYPGNSEPTMHVVGSEETDVTINGRFHDKKFQSDAYYGASTEMQQLIESIRLRGNVLRIRLGEWQRYGFLTNAQFDMKKLSDVEYKLTFSIIGFNLPKNYRTLETQNSIPFEINKQLTDGAAALLLAQSSIPSDIPQSLFNAISELISEVAGAITALTSFVDTVLSVVKELAATISKVLGLIRHAINLVQRYKIEMGKIAFNLNQSATFSAGSGAGSTAATTAVNPIIAQQRAQAFLSNSISSMSDLAKILAEMQQRFRAMQETTPLTRYRVVDGDSLQKISGRFYSNADHWKKIYDHNKLTSTVLVSGSVLEIPKI
jgi:hypothetical protein